MKAYIITTRWQQITILEFERMKRTGYAYRCRYRSLLDAIKLVLQVELLINKFMIQTKQASYSSSAKKNATEQEEPHSRHICNSLAYVLSSTEKKTELFVGFVSTIPNKKYLRLLLSISVCLSVAVQAYFFVGGVRIRT